MSDLAIFIYGLLVTAIVAAACILIVWGIVQERRDREGMEVDVAVGSGSHPSPAEAESHA